MHIMYGWMLSRQTCFSMEPILDHPSRADKQDRLKMRKLRAVGGDGSRGTRLQALLCNDSAPRPVYSSAELGRKPLLC